MLLFWLQWQSSTVMQCACCMKLLVSRPLVCQLLSSAQEDKLETWLDP